VTEADPAPDARFAIVRATFYDELARRLTEGALRGFEEHGIGKPSADLFDVPGAFELPMAAQACAESGKYAGVACLGAVIRGDTYHFEVVANESARGLMDVALETGIPVANGILTTDDEAQALARKDKGAEAVRVAVEMARLRHQLAEKWR